VTLLLARSGKDVRPVGGSGDKGRDAVSGLYRAKGGEELAVTISLNEKWDTKITADINRLTKAGFKPRDVISVTNRPTSETRRSALQAAATKDHKINLTINDVRWLIIQLHLRENLDLRGEYLKLPPPRPAFFMDIGEYAQLLERRGLLSSHFVGRDSELNELERFFTQGVPVVLEAAGGLGKTRLALELARSGNSDYRWFFVDADRAFSIDYVAEVEAGYDARSCSTCCRSRTAHTDPTARLHRPAGPRAESDDAAWPLRFPTPGDDHRAADRSERARQGADRRAVPNQRRLGRPAYRALRRQHRNRADRR
jgi:hypothetical protein